MSSPLPPRFELPVVDSKGVLTREWFKYFVTLASAAGPWNNNGVGNATTAQLTSKADSINTAGKFLGRLSLNSTNHHLYAAQGSASTDPWIPVDVGDTGAPAAIVPV